MMRIFRVAGMMLGIALWQSVAFADLPEPKGKTENPNVVAARKAIDAKDYKGAHSMLGYAYRKTNVFDKSMEHYQRALKLDSNHRSAHEYLGELYLDMNQPDNAEKQLAALKKACPFFGKCEEYEDLKKAIDAYKAKKK